MTITPQEKEVFLSRLNEIIENNLTNESFDVSELTQQMGMSRTSLHRKIKAVKGTSISSFIRQVRLEKASELIRHSSSTISEIAFEVGFNSVSYFLKSFRNFYGYSPGELRKSEHVNINSEGLQPVQNRIGFLGKRVSLTLMVSIIVIIITVAIVGIIFMPTGVKGLPLEKSIAVLPFINDSPEQEGMYFINGTMEAILGNLSKVEDIRVISRTSVNQYRESTKTIPVIAEELNVSYILEGSGLRHEDRLFLRVQLIDAGDNHIWSESYEKAIDGISELFSEVALSIAAEINVHISPEEKNLIEKIPTTNREAYEMYLRAIDGLHFYSGSQKLDRSMALLRQAVEFDPDFADAYAEIGRIFYTLYRRNPYEYSSYPDSMLLYTNKALVLDSEIELAHLHKGFYFRTKGDLPRALEHFIEASRINPNSLGAYNGMGWAYFAQNYFVQAIENFYKAALLNRGENLPPALGGLGFAYGVAGFPEQYKELLEEKVSLDGDSVGFFFGCTVAEHFAGNLPGALEAAQKAFAFDKENLVSMESLTMINYNLGNIDEAVEYCYLYLDRMEATKQFRPNSLHVMIFLLRHSGDIERADYYLEKLVDYNRTPDENPLAELERIVRISALLGDYEKALDYLEQIARQERLYAWVTLYRSDPIFSEINTDPEFLRIIDEIERKFKAQRERDRQLLEEKGLN